MAKLLWWKVVQKAGSSGGMYQGPRVLWQQPMPAVAHCQPGKESLVCSLFFTKLLVPPWSYVNALWVQKGAISIFGLQENWDHVLPCLICSQTKLFPSDVTNGMNFQGQRHNFVLHLKVTTESSIAQLWWVFRGSLYFPMGNENANQYSSFCFVSTVFCF